MKADVRATWLLRLLGLTPERTLPLMYPRMLDLGPLLAEPGDLENLKLPPPVRYLSAAKLSDDSIYVLENGFEAYIHVGERVPPGLLLAVLGQCPSVLFACCSSRCEMDRLIVWLCYDMCFPLPHACNNAVRCPLPRFLRQFSGKGRHTALRKARVQ